MAKSRQQPKQAHPPEQRTFKVYIPEQAGDLADAVEKAAERLGFIEKRKISASEWIVMAIKEKLANDYIPSTIRSRFPNLTPETIREVLVWKNPGIGFAGSADFATAQKHSQEMARLRLSAGQLCAVQASLSLEDAEWLLAHGARETQDPSEIRKESLRHAGYLQ